MKIHASSPPLLPPLVQNNIPDPVGLPWILSNDPDPNNPFPLDRVSMEFCQY